MSGAGQAKGLALRSNPDFVRRRLGATRNCVAGIRGCPSPADGLGQLLDSIDSVGQVLTPVNELVALEAKVFSSESRQLQDHATGYTNKAPDNQETQVRVSVKRGQELQHLWT